jgi:hypothetical protein
LARALIIELTRKKEGGFGEGGIGKEEIGLFFV